MKQLSRAGFKIVVAHGQGPSTNYVMSHAEEFFRKYHIKVFTCWITDLGDLCLICDHTATNETSIIKNVRPDLVKMNNLPGDSATWPLGIMGKDPGKYASRTYGKKIIDHVMSRMIVMLKL